jgi:hypothetical protein
MKKKRVAEKDNFVQPAERQRELDALDRLFDECDPKVCILAKLGKNLSRLTHDERGLKPVKCASPTYSEEQPELSCPYYGLYELNGERWCEYHYLAQCTPQQWCEHFKAKEAR